jgi:cob(I)alamin adenosyltransferase
MGYRLSKIYTRSGDDGSTGLGNGERIDKDHPRMECIGNVDELNSSLGVLLAQPLDDSLRGELEEIQHLLFDLGGELCLPGHTAIEPAHAQWLEHCLDQRNAKLPPLKEFILPGGGQPAAFCHLARTVCRRTERSMVQLHRLEPLQAPALAFINRLSDYLFVVARQLAREQGEEVLWRKPPERRLPR